VTIPKGASFAYMVQLKGKSDIGGKINALIIQPVIDNNSRLAPSDLPDFNGPNRTCCHNGLPSWAGAGSSHSIAGISRDNRSIPKVLAPCGLTATK